MFAKHTGSDNFVCALEFILPDFRNYPLRTSRFRTGIFVLRRKPPIPELLCSQNITLEGGNALQRINTAMLLDPVNRISQIGLTAAHIMAVRTQQVNLLLLQHAHPSGSTAAAKERGIGLHKHRQLFQFLRDAKCVNIFRTYRQEKTLSHAPDFQRSGQVSGAAAVIRSTVPAVSPGRYLKTNSPPHADRSRFIGLFLWYGERKLFQRA